MTRSVLEAKRSSKRFSKREQSLTICHLTLNQILTQLMKHLPPSTDKLKSYANSSFYQATSKLVDINLLQPNLGSPSQEMHANLKKVNIDTQKKIRFQVDLIQKNQKLVQLDQQNTPIININQKYSETQIPRNIHKTKPNNQIKIIGHDQKQNKFTGKQLLKKIRIKQLEKSFSHNNNNSLVEDKQVVIVKEGIKFVKKEQLKNLIRHRASKQYSSMHQTNNNIALVSKKEIGLLGQQQKNGQKINQIQSVLMKSSKSFSVLNSIKSNKNLALTQSKIRTKKRISINNFNQGETQFMNLKDYYHKKQADIDGNHNQTIKKNGSLKNGSPLFYNSHHKTQLSQSQPFSDMIWKDPLLIEDQADVMINKLRERKQKFYRNGINFSNGESFNNTKRQHGHLNQGSTKNANIPGMINYDYNGQMMQSVKYDTLKIQPHYQELDFSINQNDQNQTKKKQRKGYRYRGGINLKMVDHHKFIPHPNYKHDPLAETGGMVMKQNAGQSLKKGVELNRREINNIPATVQAIQNQKVNKAAFEFLYNDQMAPNKVTYSQFSKFKQCAQSVSLHNAKSPSSRRRLFDLANSQTILSKKCIAFIGGLKSTKNVEDESNKIHRSQNRKALDLLMNREDSFTVDHQIQNGASPKVKKKVRIM